MKKLLCITLIALACLSAFGCTQEPSTTPNEVETATPEATPNEVETITPNEIDVVTPNEPEVPAEPETPIEPEVPTEPEENVIVLPEADENTKYITIDFPADFPEDPYTQPNLVSPEEFEWGEYLPLVSFAKTRYQRQSYLNHYAFLSEATATLDDGIREYNKLNSKYTQRNQLSPTGRFGRADDITAPENKEAYELLTQSRIIYVSKDADTLGRFSVTDVTDTEKSNDDTFYDTWSGKYELIRENEVVFTDEINTLDQYYLSDNEITSKGCQPYMLGKKVKYASDKSFFVCANENYAVFCENIGSDTSQTLLIYDLNTLTAVYSIRILFPKNDYQYSCAAEQLIDDRYLLLNYYEEEKENGDIFCLYVYDLMTEEIEYLESFASSPMLSYDKKYLIYTSHDNYSSQEMVFHEPLHGGKQGFFVKSLENNETVLFTGNYEWGDSFYPINWIDKDKLNTVINS